MISVLLMVCYSLGFSTLYHTIPAVLAVGGSRKGYRIGWRSMLAVAARCRPLHYASTHLGVNVLAWIWECGSGVIHHPGCSGREYKV